SQTFPNSAHRQQDSGLEPSSSYSLSSGDVGPLYTNPASFYNPEINGPVIQNDSGASSFTTRDAAASRQSFRMAMGNPCGTFVDII
uniref:Uncharacterized protein n=1 Tax=Romanomermis culicivorax TaxID=13658 RepID=A0A915HVE1_ROMCU